MTNKEMAIKILNEHDRLGVLKPGTLGESVAIDCIVKALNDKDNHFKEYLENLKGIYVKDRDYFHDKGDSVTSNHFDMKIACIQEIINELFGE